VKGMAPQSRRNGQKTKSAERDPKSIRKGGKAARGAKVNEGYKAFLIARREWGGGKETQKENSDS